MILMSLLLGGIFLTLNIIPYIIFNIVIPFFSRNTDLKKKYNAEWALVTGANSGIGKSIVQKLASQQLNVILVGLDDQLLETCYQDLKKQYPKQQFRKVGVDLSAQGETYMTTIQKATVDVNCQLIFNIAGYMVTGFFYNTKCEAQIKNLECNVTSGVKITHHFVSKMIEKKLPGCVVFAASPAGILPSPFSCLYGSTKAFLSEFAQSLAIEVKPFNVDVMAFFPSPVSTGFYTTPTVNHKIQILDFFKGMAVKPETLPDTIFDSLGHNVVKDVGGIAMGFRLLSKIVDGNFLAVVCTKIFHLFPDFKNNLNK